MANELKHGDQGCSLTKAEFEGVGLHVFNSQATGDIVYAASSSQLSRLEIGSSNALLEVASGIPGWTTSPTIGATAWANANHAHAASNSGGTIAITATTGTLAVGNGGTGATTFTDGGVLLGSGSGAITALAVLTDGQMIVGDGSGDPVAESGATLRTSIGVGTGDTLSISGLTLSTDLSVANGGTGASTLTANGVLIGNGTSAVGAVDMSTKGHILIGDGSGNPQMLGVGCNDQVLTACSGETTGVKWAAAGGGVGCGPLQISGGSNSAPAYSYSGDTDLGVYRVGADQLGIAAGGVMQWTVQNGPTFFNDTASTKVGKGVVLNMGCSNDFILDFQSAKVAHGITGTAETDTFSFFRKDGACTGGVEWFGLSETTLTMSIHGVGTGENTTKSTSAHGTIVLNAGKANGTAIQALGTDGNLVTIHDHAIGARFIFDVEGTFHADVASTTFDDHCDVELMRGLLGQTVDGYKESYQDRFGKDLMYNLPFYEENKLIGKDSIRWEERACGRMQQRAMINFTGLTMLHHSTIIQLADRVDARLTALENQIALQGGE